MTTRPRLFILRASLSGPTTRPVVGATTDPAPRGDPPCRPRSISAQEFAGSLHEATRCPDSRLSERARDRRCFCDPLRFVAGTIPFIRARRNLGGAALDGVRRRVQHIVLLGDWV